MKSLGIIGLFFIFVVVSGFGAAVFAQIFMQNEAEDLTAKKLNNEILKNYNELENELKDTEKWINSLDSQVKSMQKSIDAINQEKADAIKAKEIKNNENKEYSKEELEVIQKQIDELEIFHNLVNALRIKNQQAFSEKTKDVIKAKDEAEEAIREQERIKRRAEEKVQVEDYLKDSFGKKLTSLKDELKLSDGQEKAVSKILQDVQTQIMDLRYGDEANNGRGNRQEMMRRYNEIQSNYEENVGKVLTPSQYDDFKSKNLNSLFPRRGGRNNGNR